MVFLTIRGLFSSSENTSTDRQSTDIHHVNAVVQSQKDTCTYESLSDITQNGPFSICSDGEEIYIFFEGKKLYRINAKLSDFPEKDRQSIEKGIVARDKLELFEIACYLES